MTATVTSLRPREVREIRPMPPHTVSHLRATMTCRRGCRPAEGAEVDMHFLAVTHNEKTGHPTDVTTKSVTTYWPAVPGPGEGTAA